MKQKFNAKVLVEIEGTQEAGNGGAIQNFKVKSVTDVNGSQELGNGASQNFSDRTTSNSQGSQEIQPGQVQVRWTPFDALLLLLMLPLLASGASLLFSAIFNPSPQSPGIYIQDNHGNITIEN